MELAHVVVLVGYLGRHDHLFLIRHGLGVVALDEAVLGLHDPALGVADVGLGLGGVGGFGLAAPELLAAGLLFLCPLGQVGLVGLFGCLVLGVQDGLGLSQALAAGFATP